MDGNTQRRIAVSEEKSVAISSNNAQKTLCTQKHIPHSIEHLQVISWKSIEVDKSTVKSSHKTPDGSTLPIPKHTTNQPHVVRSMRVASKYTEVDAPVASTKQNKVLKPREVTQKNMNLSSCEEGKVIVYANVRNDENELQVVGKVSEISKKAMHAQKQKTTGNAIQLSIMQQTGDLTPMMLVRVSTASDGNQKKTILPTETKADTRQQTNTQMPTSGTLSNERTNNQMQTAQPSKTHRYGTRTASEEDKIRSTGIAENHLLAYVAARCVQLMTKLVVSMILLHLHDHVLVLSICLTNSFHGPLGTRCRHSRPEPVKETQIRKNKSTNVTGNISYMLHTRNILCIHAPA